MVTGHAETNRPVPIVVLPPPPEDEPITEIKPEKKRRAWSPKARAEAAERMRARIAAGKMVRKSTPSPDATTKEPVPQFSEADLRITVPAKQRKTTLTDADWPEIKQMLAAGKTSTAIASDYDEEPEGLDFFISSCQRREQREGNFAAPQAGGA